MSYKNWRVNSSIFILASIQLANVTFASNVFSEYVLHLDEAPIKYFYLNMIRDDLITIIVIMFIHFILKVAVQKSTITIMVILLLNTLMYAYMHIDIVILQHKEAPWIWWDYFYTVFINTIEVFVASTIVIYGFVSKKSNNIREVS
jgi:hypothetical protein